MIQPTRNDWNRAWRGGAVAGVVGGICISCVLLGANLLHGNDLWMTLKFAGAPFLGERALQPGFDGVAVIVGVLSHFAVSVMWGVLFATAFFGLSDAMTVVAGAFWGIVVWVVMYYLALPALGLAELTSGMPTWMAVLNHLVFGIGTSIGFLPYQRRRAPITVHRT